MNTINLRSVVYLREFNLIINRKNIRGREVMSISVSILVAPTYKDSAVSTYDLVNFNNFS